MASMRTLSLIVLAWALPATAQPTEEWLVQDALPELTVGYEAEQAGSSIVERIPPGETVLDWSRMVTTQRFAGVIARGGTLASWVQAFFGSLARGCPGYRAAEPRFGSAGAHATAAFRVDCPRNPSTGRPETFLLRAFAGAADLHVVQIAFRHVPTAAEVQWAQDHLASAVLCDRSSREARCRR